MIHSLPKPSFGSGVPRCLFVKETIFKWQLPLFSICTEHTSFDHGNLVGLLSPLHLGCVLLSVPFDVWRDGKYKVEHDIR